MFLAQASGYLILRRAGVLAFLCLALRLAASTTSRTTS
jgi:hypothetical protein